MQPMNAPAVPILKAQSRILRMTSAGAIQGGGPLIAEEQDIAVRSTAKL